ncbi:MAG: methionyl-tRNA formyltransferase fmt [Chloroflexi bacterium]|nr:methionyl-tRNA formyltransferase fmt [Chloroflexota bacterium]
MERARAVFFGSGEFAVPVLQALAAAPEVKLVGVVSTPPRPAGRRAVPTATPVARAVETLGCPLQLPARLRDPAAVAAIAALEPDLGILSDYGRIVPRAILDLPDRGILNLHPSLLPRHRGASPIPATILDGDAATGVTLFRMDEGMDTGPIVAVERLALSGREDAPALERRLAEMAAVLLSRSLGPWLRGELAAVPQPADGVTVTRLLRREDGRLDPRRAAPVLERQVRAYRPWPGTWLETEAGRLGVLQGTLAPGDGVSGGVPPAAVGTLVPDGPGLALVAGDGGLLRLLEVQPAGGRVMDGAAFRRGHPRIVGTVVGTVAG